MTEGVCSTALNSGDLEEFGTASPRLRPFRIHHLKPRARGYTACRMLSKSLSGRYNLCKREVPYME